MAESQQRNMPGQTALAILLHPSQIPMSTVSKEGKQQQQQCVAREGREQKRPLPLQMPDLACPQGGMGP